MSYSSKDRPKEAATPGGPDAMPAPEVIGVSSRRVKCDGGGGPLGHPLVFYEMGEEDFVECGYCDRRFVLAAAPLQPAAGPAKRESK